MRHANYDRSSSDPRRRRPRNRTAALYRASRRHATLCQRATKTDQGHQQIRQAAAIGTASRANAEAIPRAALAALPKKSRRRLGERRRESTYSRYAIRPQPSLYRGLVDVRLSPQGRSAACGSSNIRPLAGAIVRYLWYVLAQNREWTP